MKKIVIICNFIFLIFLSNISNAQLFGKGKVITKEYTIKNFDKVSIEDFDGQIEIEIGKPYAIKIEIDENLEPRLTVTKASKENQLNISLEGNKNGKLYLEKTRIKIKVCLPEASFVNHRGNTTVKIQGIAGRYFGMENSGNGDVLMVGSTGELDIRKNGNGNINAGKLVTKTAKVKNYGNGNVIVNSQISLLGLGAGNGSIMQLGPGKIDPLSGIVGNGDVRKI
jgi:hypothetical protein